MKTVKQISDELKVSRQKIYRFLKDNNAKTEIINNVTYITEEAEQDLYNTFGNSLTEQDKSSQVKSMAWHDTPPQQPTEQTTTAPTEQATTKEPTEQEKIIDLLHETIETLKEQLKIKDTQINEQIKIISEKDIQISGLINNNIALTTTIQQAHTLHHNEQQLLLTASEPETQQETEQHKKIKKSFFKRLFSKSTI